MPEYTYSAFNAQGVRESGEAIADSEDALRSELIGRGLLVQEVALKRSLPGFAGKKIRLEEFSLFNQEFTALLRAGLTIPDALSLAKNRPDSPVLGRALSRILEDIRNGMSLSEACKNHPNVFEQLYIAALKTGERTGELTNVLGRYQEYLKHRVALLKKLSQAMTYPAFLILVLVSILTILFLFVLPRFVAMYTDLGADLPYATRVLIKIVENLYIIGPFLFISITISIAAWKRWIATTAGRLRADTIKDRLPYIGSMVRTVFTAQLARSLSTLLAAGTPLIEALSTTAHSLNNQLYVQKLEHATKLVIEGNTLAQAVRVTGLTPEMAARMIEVGEASGGLDTMLSEVAQFYEEILDARISRVMSLIEPLMMLIMGVMIGGIIIVMYLPIFHLADIIK